jgi:hypothetical protein
MSGLLLALLACGDGGAGPNSGGGGRDAAAQLERLADSVADGGYSPSAEALRHAAEIVRLAGHATPVTLTIDGTARSFLAVAEQLDFPYLECRWPSDSGIPVPGDSGVAPPPDTVTVPPDTVIATASDTIVAHPDTGSAGDCTVVGTSSMRTLIAWEPEHLAEVVRIVSDVGNTTVGPTVPDVMAGLPSPIAVDGNTLPPEPGDTGSAGGGGSGGDRSPGFMGEYLVRDVGSWWAVEGTQANTLEELAGACTSENATFDYVEFRCAAARFRFEFDMRVEPVRYERLTGSSPAGPDGDHRLAMAGVAVDGVRLTAFAWSPRPLPPLDPPGEPPREPPGSSGPPVPVDSTGVVPGHP